LPIERHASFAKNSLSDLAVGCPGLQTVADAQNLDHTPHARIGGREREKKAVVTTERQQALQGRELGRCGLHSLDAASEHDGTFSQRSTRNIKPDPAFAVADYGMLDTARS